MAYCNKIDKYLTEGVTGLRSWPSQKSMQASNIMSAVPWLNNCKLVAALPILLSLNPTQTIWGKGNFNLVVFGNDLANLISLRTASAC